MNETEFKHHLKDLVHGHHHPEEHDWDGKAPSKSAPKTARAKRKPAAKTARKK